MRITIPRHSTAEKCAAIIAESLQNSGYAYPWDIAERICALLPRPIKKPRDWHDYSLTYRDRDGGKNVWTYDGTDAILTAQELIDTFYAHQEPEGMPEAVEFMLATRDGEEIWSK